MTHTLGNLQIRIASSLLAAAPFVVAGGCKPESNPTPKSSSASALAPTEANCDRAITRPPVDRPNIVLVVLCTFRYSHMSCAGYHRTTTPFLDSVAAEGVLFTNAYSSSSWTKPSAASILTGLTPNVHQMTDYYSQASIRRQRFTPKRTLSDNILTLPEALVNHGYATAGWINNVQAGEFFNLTQGFSESVTDYRLSTSDMVGQFSDWLARQQSDQPFFAMILSRDAHRKFDPRYEYFKRFDRSSTLKMQERQYSSYLQHMYDESERLADGSSNGPSQSFITQYVDLYDAELAQIDDALSEIPVILERDGRANDTILIITADHGERLFDHNLIAHGAPLDEATVHIPLILNGPGIPVGRRINRVVRNIDIYPTVMQLTGATGAPYLQGRDLLGELGDDEAGAAFASIEPTDALGWQEQYLVRSGNLAYYVNLSEGERLYDISRDPGETKSLIEQQPEAADRLGEYLKWWLRQERILRKIVGEAGSRELDEETIEQLRSLGYIDK